MVLKTRPDRPVQLWTDLYTGLVMWKIRKFKKNQEKPVTGSLIGITGDRNDRTGYEADRNERENITLATHDFGFLSIPTSRRCSPTTPASCRCLSITLASHRRRISAKHQIRSSLAPPHQIRSSLAPPHHCGCRMGKGTRLTELRRWSSPLIVIKTAFI